MWRLHEKDKRKSDLARRYGLTQRLMEVGWAGLSAKESGRIGGGLQHRIPHRQLAELVLPGVAVGHHMQAQRVLPDLRGGAMDGHRQQQRK